MKRASLVEELPELLQDLLLGAGDVRSAFPSFSIDDLGLPRHLVHGAGAAVSTLIDADGDDAAAERRERRRRARLLLGLALVQPLDQVLADVRVVLFPRHADGLDVDDEFFHGCVDVVDISATSVDLSTESSSSRPRPRDHAARLQLVDELLHRVRRLSAARGFRRLSSLISMICSMPLRPSFTGTPTKSSL